MGPSANALTFSQIALNFPPMIYAHIDRDLTEEEAAGASAVSESKAPTLTRVSDRHRRLARMLADGVSPGDAAVACGFTPSRVSILKADPTFNQLVATYRAQIEHHFGEVAEKLAVMTGIAADEVIERLEDDPKAFETEQLLKIITTGADRIGLAPNGGGRGNGNELTVNLAVRLQSARERARVIDGEARRITDDD